MSVHHMTGVHADHYRKSTDLMIKQLSLCLEVEEMCNFRVWCSCVNHDRGMLSDLQQWSPGLLKDGFPLTWSLMFGCVLFTTAPNPLWQ